MPEKVTKVFITPDQYREDSFHLGQKVLQSGFKPKKIVALWRGGAPAGLYLHEYFEYQLGRENRPDYLPICVTAYDAGIDNRKKQVEVTGIELIIKNLSPDDDLLIVDDVFDTGNSIEAVMKALEEHSQPRYMRMITGVARKVINGLEYVEQRCRLPRLSKYVTDALEQARKRTSRLPRNIRIATLYHKPDKRDENIQRTPDFRVRTYNANVWIVYPHEINDSTPEEIREHMGPEIARLLRR